MVIFVLIINLGSTVFLKCHHWHESHNVLAPAYLTVHADYKVD
jgi:hypothetical protein